MSNQRREELVDKHVDLLNSYPDISDKCKITILFAALNAYCRNEGFNKDEFISLSKISWELADKYPNGDK